MYLPPPGGRYNLQVARDLADLAHFLATSPAGSLLLPDFKHEQASAAVRQTMLRNNISD
jgi:hypothetical protein